MTQASGKPATSLATLGEASEAQRRDSKSIRAAITARDAAMADLDPRTYSAEHVARRRQEIADAFTHATRDSTARMAERADTAKVAREQWNPARRRLDASVANPGDYAALAGRLSSLGLGQLEMLADDAVRRGDWLLADAIVAQFARIPKNDHADVARCGAIEQRLNSLDRENAAEAEAHVVAIGTAFIQTRIAAAAAAGTPIPAADRLTLTREYPFSENLAAV